jgi:hypothetical protein
MQWLAGNADVLERTFWSMALTFARRFPHVLITLRFGVINDGASIAIGKAPASKISAWANQRGWSQISLVSGFNSSYQVDYKCQTESDDRQSRAAEVTWYFIAVF